MPKRTDLTTILLIGSGPIVIGQACEFDYSGVQACKALREEGYRVVLVNSNPATIMTDPEFADRTYVEPMTAEVLTRIIEQERPEAVLPTIGGQTALNLAIEIAEAGVLERYGVELIGAKLPAIKKAEDRDLFKAAMERIGLDLPRSGYARTLAEAEAVKREIALPLIVRPSRTLGGTGGGVVTTESEFTEIVRWGLAASPTSEVLIEESIAGWKEFELEVMRDAKDNVVIVCSIENFDPMGIHTGDSITVAPAQTLTDKEYQLMRDAAIRIIREIGVDTGGSNIQFGVHPENGRLVVIEMNPRVSRSSALASKATGFPIAKIAAKLAIGYTLDEIPNDITRETPACFEPTIDYVVTKIPRFTFEKFPAARDVLGPQMKSVGEAMAIGRTFKESLQKAMRSLETGSYGFEPTHVDLRDREALQARLQVGSAERLWVIGDAFRAGMSVDEIYRASGVDPWFLRNIEEIIAFESAALRPGMLDGDGAALATAKRLGFSDVRIATVAGTSEDAVRAARRSSDVAAVFKRVDTCGAEFAAHTPYFYSSFDAEDETAPERRKKIMILGGGPNRIGQGIEFDYCCVHAAFALRADGFETIMVNCNPETVSTDYDTSDRLYFEPLTLEDVLAICARERPDGVIVQFGGQTPLKLAVPLERAGVPIIGTSPDSIDRAEDRERFDEVLRTLNLLRPENGIARTDAEAIAVADRIGYPVLVRPSYVLGGRAMEIIYEAHDLERYVRRAFAASPDRPLLIDRFLEDAIEIDVDAVSDGRDVVIGGIMEHIERAGVHSGDSACSLPPIHHRRRGAGRDPQPDDRARPRAARRRPHERAVRGAGPAGVHPRGESARVAHRAIRQQGDRRSARQDRGPCDGGKDARGGRLHPRGRAAARERQGGRVSVPQVPRCRHRPRAGDEVDGRGDGHRRHVRRRLRQGRAGGGHRPAAAGTVFISVRPEDRRDAVAVARRLRDLGFSIVATSGTGAFLREAGITVDLVNKVFEGSPHVVDALREGTIALVINTPQADAQSLRDSFSIRRTALERKIPYFTTIAGAQAAAEAIAVVREGALTVTPLQEYHRTMR